MRRLRDLMTWESWLRYILWRLVKFPVKLTIQLTSGERLTLRPHPSDDVQTAFEIFVAQVYKPPLPLDSESVQSIVDLGANVGYSVIYFARRYPTAKVIAFEAHPLHAKIAKYNLGLNGVSQELDWVCAAASNQTGDAFLTDEGVCSTVISKHSAGSLPVRLVDIFEYLKNKKIDLLKIDIEGGEYRLLEDSRFGNIQAQIIVLEYHITPEKPDGYSWCYQRLNELGYRIEKGAWEGKNNGFIWAYREVTID